MSKLLKRFIAASLLGSIALVPAAVRAQQPPFTFQLVPQAPLSLEQVSLRVTSGGADSCISARVSMALNLITVFVYCEITFPGLSFPVSSVDVELGRFPAGDYEVLVTTDAPPHGDKRSICGDRAPQFYSSLRFSNR